MYSSCCESCFFKVSISTYVIARTPVVLVVAGIFCGVGLHNMSIVYCCLAKFRVEGCQDSASSSGCEDCTGPQILPHIGAHVLPSLPKEA